MSARSHKSAKEKDRSDSLNKSYHPIQLKEKEQDEGNVTKKSGEPSTEFKRKETVSEKVRGSIITTPLSDKKPPVELYANAFMRTKPVSDVASIMVSSELNDRKVKPQPGNYSIHNVIPKNRGVSKENSKDKEHFMGLERLYKVVVSRYVAGFKALKMKVRPRLQHMKSTILDPTRVNFKMKTMKSASESKLSKIINQMETPRSQYSIPLFLREFFAAGTCLIELDDGSYKHAVFNVQIQENQKNQLSVSISHVMPDFCRHYYFTLSQTSARECSKLNYVDPESRRSYERIVNTTLLEFMPVPPIDIDTIIRYQRGSLQVKSSLCIVLNHFIVSKVRYKKINGRTYENLRKMSDREMILHSLFKIVREDNLGLENEMCRLVATKNNIPIIDSQATRKGKVTPVVRAVPVAYDFIKEDQPSKANDSLGFSKEYSMAPQNSLVNEMDKALSYTNLTEAHLNPSDILKSTVFRLDYNTILKNTEAMLSSKNMVSYNPFVGQYILHTKWSYSLLCVRVLPPAFKVPSRNNVASSQGEIHLGTWVDHLDLQVSVYDFTLRRLQQFPSTFSVKKLASSLPLSKIGSLYRGFVYEKPNLWFLKQIWSYLRDRLYIQNGTVSFDDQYQEMIIADSPNLTNSLPFSSDESKMGLLSRGNNPKREHNGPGLPFSPFSIWPQVIKPSSSEFLPLNAYKEVSRYGKPGAPQLTPGQSLYMDFNFCGRDMRIKIKYFHNPDIDLDEVFVSAYDIITHENYRLHIRDKASLERIKQIMERQVEENKLCPQFLKVSSNLALDLKKESKGRNLSLSDVYERRTMIVRENSPEHIKYTIQCGFETVYLDNNFIKKIFYFTSISKALGSVYVTCKVYYSFKLVKNECIVLLNLTTLDSRFGSSKIIFNAVDIKEYFAKDIFTIIHSDDQVIKLLTLILSTFVFFKSKVYSKLQIPLAAVKRIVPNKYVYSLQNEFDERALFPNVGKKEAKLKGEYEAPSCYFHQKIQHAEVLTKCTKRYNGQYWIITVVREKLMDRLDILAYLPQARRRFQCSMTIADIEMLSEEFKNGLLQASDKQLQSLQDKAQSFAQYEDLVESLATGAPLKTKPMGITGGSNKGGKKSYMDVRFWNDLLKQSKIIIKNKDMLLKIDTYKGVLKELLWHNLCIADGLVFELTVHLEPKQKKDTMKVERFQPIPLNRLNRYSLLVRMIFVDKKAFHSDKLALEELFKMYKRVLLDKITATNAFSRGNFEGNQVNASTAGRKSSMTASDTLGSQGNVDTAVNLYELSLSGLVDLVRILETNMVDSVRDRYLNVLDSDLTYFENEKIVSKEIIYKDKFERRMKLNSKLNLAIQSDPYYRYYNDILLHKSLFTVSPQQMLVILFNKRELEFSFVLYECETSKQRTTRVPVSQVEIYVPHLLSLIENKHFTEVGRRVIAAFKNSLLISACIHKDDPDRPF